MTERPFIAPALKPELNHYFLFAGEVYFELPDDGGHASVRLNTLLVTPTDRLALAQINKSG